MNPPIQQPSHVAQSEAAGDRLAHLYTLAVAGSDMSLVLARIARGPWPIDEQERSAAKKAIAVWDAAVRDAVG